MEEGKYMKVENVALQTIKPYEKNPRKNDGAVKGVAESIKRFGFQQPIVVDKDNVIVVGHTRYKAAKKLGLTAVPCVRADDLTQEQVKAYRILDNKLNELASWDFAALSSELSTFSIDFTEFDIEMPDFQFDECCFIPEHNELETTTNAKVDDLNAEAASSSLGESQPERDNEGTEAVKACKDANIGQGKSAFHPGVCETHGHINVTNIIAKDNVLKSLTVTRVPYSRIHALWFMQRGKVDERTEAYEGKTDFQFWAASQNEIDACTVGLPIIYVANVNPGDSALKVAKREVGIKEAITETLLDWEKNNPKKKIGAKHE